MTNNVCIIKIKIIIYKKMTKKILLNSIFYLILIILLTVSYTKDTFVNLLSSSDQIAQIGFISVYKS
jgi:hypothetical protein